MILLSIREGKFGLISQIKAQFEQTAKEPEEPNIDLSDLVADIDSQSRKAILYMPTWPKEVEEEKVLFIPSTGIGTIYLCPKATSLEEVNPRCQGIMILDVGESKENLFVDATAYDGQEYYLVYGIKGTGGGEAHKTQLTYTGDLSGQFSDSVNLTAILTDKNGNPLVDKNIVFEIGDQSASTITNNNGVTTTSLTLNQIPGNYYFVDTTFAGDEGYLPSSDSKAFEVQKENVVIDVSDKECSAFDTTALEAEIRDDDGDLLRQENGSGCFVEFKIATTTIATSSIDEYGKSKVEWNINIIPKEIIEKYPISVTLAGNDFYLSAKSEGEFTLKSAKWLKQDTIKELEAAKTGNKKTDKNLNEIIKHIQDSLDENLWQDPSHLVFFKKDCSDPETLKFNYDKIDFEGMFVLESGKMEPKMKGLFKGKCFAPKIGITVFYEEYTATKLMLAELKGNPRIPDELEQVFEEAIGKLVKADQLLAKVAIFDAKNTPIQNPKFQKIVKQQMELTKKELQKANEGLQKERLDKAIMRLAKSWLYSQLAIKFANLNLKE